MRITTGDFHLNDLSLGIKIEILIFMHIFVTHGIAGYIFHLHFIQLQRKFWFLATQN